MGRYYKKNAYQRLNMTVARGAQRAEEEISSETNEISREPNCRFREENVRKCYKCGIMLKDKRRYIIDWINQDLQPLCLKCYH